MAGLRNLSIRWPRLAAWASIARALRFIASDWRYPMTLMEPLRVPSPAGAAATRAVGEACPDMEPNRFSSAFLDSSCPYLSTDHASRPTPETCRRHRTFARTWPVSHDSSTGTDWYC